MKEGKILIILLLSLIISRAGAQDFSQGKVYERNGTALVPLPGAVLYSISSGGNTLTDSTGNFKLATAVFPDTIVVSFIGHTSDTVVFHSSQPVKVILENSVELKTVEVTGRQGSTQISTLKTINVEKLNETELLRAACCNLSEAFETNPTVTVAYKDAVTGAKEIQLLGLSGIYSTLLTENIPNMQGIAGIYGLTFIPGPWMESIQLSKGTGSVVNGYEAATGLINVEFKKPNETSTPKFYLNLFAEDNLATELNLAYKSKVGKSFSNLLFLHGRYMDRLDDRNNDNFADVPGNKQFNIYDRFSLHVGNGVEAQFGIKVIKDRVDGGQINPSIDNGSTYPDKYVTMADNLRFEAYAKLGIVYKDHPGRSIGNIFQFVNHDLKSSFGLRKYNATERSFYYQGIFQDYIVSSKNEIKAGFTFKGKTLTQKANLTIPEANDNEVIPGAFVDYTWSPSLKFTMIAGFRADLFTHPGMSDQRWLATPRLHLKYNFSDHFIVRMSGGKSYREPVPLADHISVLASSRWLYFSSIPDKEEAWNYGANTTIKFGEEDHESTFNVDFYRTEFSKQLIVDVYSDPNVIHFYSLNGKSYSNSLQISFNTEITHGLDLRLAYKTDDVKATYNGELKEVPLVSKNRALASLAWQSQHTHWKADLTGVYDGPKKLQPLKMSSSENSPSFFTVNLQLTKEFKRVEIYAGSENLLDYRQLNPILDPANPFGTNFDATNIWGPIQGRRVYAGLRFKIK
ncbi:MAG: TonB-dependent receptor [Bacteroidia bacterium]